MPICSAFAENYAFFHKTLIFFMRLAWRSRFTIPYLVMIGFMVLDVRLTLEIIIDVEHPPPPPSPVDSGPPESDEDINYSDYETYDSM